MEDSKHLVNQNDVLTLSKALQKIAKAIEQQKKDKTRKELAIEELNFLKEHCVSNNVQLSLLSCQTLYGLVDSGILEPANVLTMFMTMLSNANTPMKVGAIGEGIINILLLDLQIATLRLKPNESYVCPFGIKTAQHPIITLMNKKNVDALDLANKLNGICTHSNENIQSNSIEFLRPVFLYALCNPIQTAYAESIWSVFLRQQKCNSSNGRALLYEIFAWCRLSPEKCLSLSMQFSDIVDLCIETNNTELALESLIVLSASVQPLIEFGYDPRNALNTLHRVIQHSTNQMIDDDVFNYTLITMSQIVHVIAPFYLGNALEVLKALLNQERLGNIIIGNMVLDSLIIRLAINGKNISSQVTADIERLIKQLRQMIAKWQKCGASSNGDSKAIKNVLYYHPTIAMNFNLVRLSTELAVDSKSNKKETLKRIISFLGQNKVFAEEMHFLLRSILLSFEDLESFDVWSDILNHLLASAKSNPTISSDTIYFMLYLLAKETEGRKQLELLRGLTSFAEIKENIPLILNTYRSLSSSSSAVLRILAIDLHTRLWQAESRTYQFLHKVLIEDDQHLSRIDKCDMNIVKANTIREICTEKASQHGTDLVAPLSKILNSSIDNDLASSIALDAVVLLCKSHTVNIVSTWKVLRGVFESKLQTRTTQSLCKFFGEVPLLKNPSNEYDLLFREASDRLWKLITNSNEIETIEAALEALQNFDFAELTLQHIPSIFYDNIKLPREYQMQIAASHSDPDNPPLTAADVVPFIPGDCWIEFLQHINQDALPSAIQFVTHLIETEMSQYRSGVYMLAEGRPEPKELQHLHARSPLRSIILFLVNQSQDKSEYDIAIKCLQCVAHKYSRPIPPLNWFFLIEYINEGSTFFGCSYDDQFKMKKFALSLAGNQIAHSGSAKSLVENYLQSFDPSAKDLREIQMALDLVATVSDGVSPRILSIFIRDSLNYLYELSASSHFNKNYFEVAIETITRVFDKKCLVPENIDIITDEICRFNDILETNSKIYEKYSTHILALSQESLDRLSTPTEWSIEKYRKSLVVRTKAISAQKPFTSASNPWMWINLLIENASDSKDPSADIERKDALLVELVDLLKTWRNENALSEWIMYFLGMVQSNLNQNNEHLSHDLFFLELFMFSIVNATGCAAFIDADLSVKNKMHWLNKFPDALWLLCKRRNWTFHMPRIFEFLYHLKTQQTNIPKELRSIILNTLICIKSNEYFLQKSTWTKFISLK